MKAPIDKCGLKFNLMTNFDYTTVIAGPMDGCYIHGLFSEGFRFET